MQPYLDGACVRYLEREPADEEAPRARQDTLRLPVPSRRCQGYGCTRPHTGGQSCLSAAFASQVRGARQPYVRHPVDVSPTQGHVLEPTADRTPGTPQGEQRADHRTAGSFDQRGPVYPALVQKRIQGATAARVGHVIPPPVAVQEHVVTVELEVV